jgi:PAS domain S-box-containing protein
MSNHHARKGVAFLVEAWEEGLRTIVLLGSAALLAWKGRSHNLQGRPGWGLILAGLLVLGAASTVDLADEFSAYDALPAALVGEPYGLAELTSESVGPVLGTLLLVAGFLMWLPLPARLSQAEAEVRSANRVLQTRAESTEASWRSLLANAPDYIVLVDRDLRIRFANRTPPGMPLDSVVGQDVGAFVPDAAQRAALVAALRRALDEDRASSLELRGPGAHGKLADYVCNVAPSRAADGSPAALLLNVDVTDRRLADEALRRSEAQFRSLADNFPDYITRFDRDLKRTYASPAVKKVWAQMGAGEPTGLRADQAMVTPAAQRKELEDALRASLADGRLRTLRQVVAMPGGQRIFEGTIVPERGADGQIESLLTVARDVTDHDTAERRLQASEERFRLATLATRDVIWDLDVATGTLHHSELLASVFGHDPARMPASLEGWGAFVHPDDLPGLVLQYQDLLSGKSRTFGGRYRFRHADGRYREVFDRAHVVTGPDGRPVRVVGAMQDVTADREAAEHKQAVARLQEVAAFKTQFLNTAAHELATPLTPIKLQLASLRGSVFGAMTPAQSEALALLDRNLDRLSLLVHDLLDAARLQGGGLKISPKPMPLGPLAADVVRSFAGKAAQDGVTLASRGLATGATVDGDEARLNQVLVNLVHNALKFTPRGGRVEVGLAVADGEAVLSVTDSGMGLTSDPIGRLFQPFSQVHDTARQNLGGTGLGLYISRSIVQQLGGQLVCGSDGPGRGACFEVRLPLLQAQPSPRQASRSAA